MKKSAKKVGKSSKIVTKNNKKLPVVEEKPVMVSTVAETLEALEEAPLETGLKHGAPVQEEATDEIAEPAANDSEAPAPLVERVPLSLLPPEPTYRELLSALSALLGIALYETLPNDACYDLIERACEKYEVVMPERPMTLPIIVFCVNKAIEVYNGRN